MTQKDRIPCVCGRLAVVQLTNDPRRFQVICVCTPIASEISWASILPAPTFQHTAEQLELLRTE